MVYQQKIKSDSMYQIKVIKDTSLKNGFGLIYPILPYFPLAFV
jgi:hypothetical protein